MTPRLRRCQAADGDDYHVWPRERCPRCVSCSKVNRIPGHGIADAREDHAVRLIWIRLLHRTGIAAMPRAIAYAFQQGRRDARSTKPHILQEKGRHCRRRMPHVIERLGQQPVRSDGLAISVSPITSFSTAARANFGEARVSFAGILTANSPSVKRFRESPGPEGEAARTASEGARP